MLSDLYEQRVRMGRLADDPAQRTVLARLAALETQLAAPPRLFHRQPPRGLYIHGDVGRGKSMLMDLFFAAAPASRKRRVHFNAFMLDVHARLHRARKAESDPLPRVIRDLAREVRLLCFDEFQVNDIADAMILSRLFTGLFNRGVVMVATSNTAPGDLYRNGLQRGLFLPFIDLLKAHLDIVAMGNGIDHRLMRLAGRPVWTAPDNDDATQRMDALFADLACGDPAAPVTIDVAGRPLPVPLAAGRICRFSFAEICTAALGAEDYLALASRFAVILVDHVPVLTAGQRNETLRFIGLVDQFYEKHHLVIASAAADIASTCAADNPYLSQYRRTASRLSEMGSQGYISQSIAH